MTIQDQANRAYKMAVAAENNGSGRLEVQSYWNTYNKLASKLAKGKNRTHRLGMEE
jgi:hypothetical protein